MSNVVETLEGVEELIKEVREAKRAIRASQDTWYDKCMKWGDIVNKWRVAPRAIIVAVIFAFINATLKVEAGVIGTGVYAAVCGGCSTIIGAYFFTGNKA